jgi:hypothetical protein
LDQIAVTPEGREQVAGDPLDVLVLLLGREDPVLVLEDPHFQCLVECVAKYRFGVN